MPGVLGAARLGGADRDGTSERLLALAEADGPETGNALHPPPSLSCRLAISTLLVIGALMAIAKLASVYGVAHLGEPVGRDSVTQLVLGSRASDFAEGNSANESEADDDADSGGFKPGDFNSSEFGPHHARTHATQSTSASITTTTSTPTTTTTTSPLVSLFCFSVMRPDTYEQELLEFALKRRTSIFKCEEFAVLARKEVSLGPGDDGDVVTWYNPVPEVPVGQLGWNGVTTNSYLNTKTFMIAWGSLVDSGLLFKHDFVAKADPDAVFLPDRLVRRVLPYKGEPVYFPNCNLWPQSPPAGPKLYGALEVYSVPAVRLYAEHHDRCESLQWHGWGEDSYMQWCMITLGARGVADFGLVGDHRCISAPCSDGTRVAFHDFKDLPAYRACFETAISR